MNTLRPFFLLIGRASVFWLGAIGAAVVGILVAGLAQPDPRLQVRFDGAFLLAFGFPAAAGWLAGAVIQEFQHTTVAMLLPGVRSRLASGFLATGLAVCVVVLGLMALNGAPLARLPVLFVVGLGAYGYGGVLLDPLSNWITSFNVVAVLFVVGNSRALARFAEAHPGAMVAIAVGIGAGGIRRLFARSTFRRKPFRPTSPLPGRFSLERSQEVQQRQVVEDRGTRAGWRAGYLGRDTGRWVRAAVHETHGALTLGLVTKRLARAWGLWIFVLLHAWIDRGEMGYAESLAKMLHDALFRSPHVPQYGEHGGPYAMVVVALTVVGAITALFTPVALHDAMPHPLSRRQRARVHFRGGLVDAAVYLFLVGGGLGAIGLLAGAFVGYPPRFDFMPLFLRVVLVTLILMPAAYGIRIRLLEATRRRAENTLLGVIVTISIFVAVACVALFVSPRLFPSPAVELAALLVALVATRFVYARALHHHYRTADLA